VCWPGVITDARLVPANLHDLVLAEELLAGVHGWALGIGLREPLPYRAPARAGPRAPGAAVAVGQAKVPRLPRWVTPTRPRIETVIGQLVERYHAKRVWARDAWQLWSRWQRKLLSHTLAVHLCQQQGLGSLRFNDLVST
jgi:hypothetical protein